MSAPANALTPQNSARLAGYVESHQATLRDTNFMRTFYNRPFERDPAVLIRRLVDIRQKLNGRLFDETDVGALHLLFAQYINEIWISEIPPQKKFNTLEVMVALLESGADVTDTLRAEGVDRPDRVALKLRNLVEAARHLFGADFHTHCEEPFSVALAIDIHRRIGRELFDHAGTFRDRMVSARGSSILYARPESIQLRLQALFSFAASESALCKKIANAEERTSRSLLMATVFLSEFLRIHPFLNGNGRTARLLLSVLLADVAVVPFSLYISTDPKLSPRSLYVNALEQRNDGFAPSVLATMILVSAHQTASTLDYHLN
ncbi:hypothetical protein HDU87_002117 [Geranomyces variabilis]|uniref:Fido domain-containing protein n=1 Tax=Geranomyces variabilis TaxID=109894 RepID=A0AAD5TRJ9_9FUNG|nr:hypothetical protein HDU87_002117 [Geranomyces variabilis]